MSWFAEGLVAATLFTVAGTGHSGPLGDGGPAGAAAIGPFATVAALPAGGFLIGERGRIRAVDASGRIRTIAGTGKPGHSGDGGPAVQAQIDPSDVTIAADGSVLFGECVTDPANTFLTYGRVRRISPDGTITTVAGGPRHQPRGDGGPAVAAALGCVSGVAALPDGGMVIADSGAYVVRRVDATGTITTIAGTGELPEERLSGSRAATQVAMRPREVAVTADGRVLIADDWGCVVLEVRPDGLASVVAGTGAERARNDDGHQAVAANVCPASVVAQSDGGFLVADEGFARLTGEEPRLRRVAPDGRISTLAGTGRFIPNPPRGFERRGDGGPALRADLRPITDVALTPDGGVLIAEGIEEHWSPVEGLIRYLAPEVPGLLAAAITRDTTRWFTPGEPAAITVTSTAAATITLTLGTRTLTTNVPAGRTQIPLATLHGRRPYSVALTATDALGRVASDRADLFPHGWLAEEIARYAVQGAVFRATQWPTVSVDAITRCRRFSATRVDCALNREGRSRCQTVVSMRLGPDRRLRWGAYRCPLRAHPRWQRRVRRLGVRETSCESSDSSCVRLNGPLNDRRLVPWG